MSATMLLGKTACYHRLFEASERYMWSLSEDLPHVIHELNPGHT